MSTYSGIILLLVFCGISLVSGDKRLVCYYSNWAQYRPGSGKFTANKIDPYLCTHVIYAFAKLKDNKLVQLEWNDNIYYSQVINLKKINQNLKVLLAVGGWSVGSPPFTAVSSHSSNRKEFTIHAIKFLRQFGFDGLDFDWDYPAKNGSPASDKYNFGELLAETRKAFEDEARATGRTRLLISAAVGSEKNTIDAAYDIPILNNNLDFITLMTYDFHGSWEKFTGHNSALYQRGVERPPQSYLNVDWVAKYWMSMGVASSKLNIGIPMYGRCFTLANRMAYTPLSPATGPCPAGTYTREPGYLAYYEVCKLVKNGGHVYRMPDARVPYAVNGNQWIGYDDIQSVLNKANYINFNGFGGAGVWTLALDDFTGSCGNGKYPLITAIKTVLRS